MHKEIVETMISMVYEKRRPVSGEDLTVQEIGDFKMVVADEHTSLYTT